MIEIIDGKEPWRSNARVKSSSPGPDPGSFRVTVELERAHPILIDNSESEDPAPSPASAADSLPGKSPAPAIGDDSEPGEEASRRAAALPSVAPAPPRPVRPVPAPPLAPSAESVSQVVRSVFASEAARLKREIQSAVSEQVEMALRGPWKAWEEKIQRQLASEPSWTEDSVRQIAEQAAKNVQMEWVATKMQTAIADAVRSALLADNERRRREIAFLVSEEVEAALGGPLMAKLHKMVETLVDQKIQDKTASHAVPGPEAAAPIAEKVVSEIEARLNAFSAELNRMLSERK